MRKKNKEKEATKPERKAQQFHDGINSRKWAAKMVMQHLVSSKANTKVIPKAAHQRKSELPTFRKNEAFTLVEVLLALAVTLIGLAPLLHLLIVSILMTESAGNLSQATLIGKAKLAEVVAAGNLDIGTDQGSAKSEDKGIVFDWKMNVTEAQIKELEAAGLMGLRKVTVTVTWHEGRRQKQILLTTYAFVDKTVTKAITT